MTPEDQRIGIAEWCGWQRPSPPYHLIDAEMAQPPDYLSDLNAIYDAVSQLPVGKRVVFYGHLYSKVCKSFTGDSPEDSMAFALVNATAAQRAEALLRTIGKWKE